MRGKYVFISPCLQALSSKQGERETASCGAPTGHTKRDFIRLTYTIAKIALSYLFWAFSKKL
jgi:hypothetical protein